MAALAKQESRRPIIARTKRPQHGLCAAGFVEIDVDEHAPINGSAESPTHRPPPSARDQLEAALAQFLDQRNPRASTVSFGCDVAVHDQNAQRGHEGRMCDEPLPDFTLGSCS